jgi:hypothetical protein
MDGFPTNLKAIQPTYCCFSLALMMRKSPAVAAYNGVVWEGLAPWSQEAA